MPKLANAAVISESSSVFDSSRSKYRNVLSNCSSCAGVRFVMFLDTICDSRYLGEKENVAAL